MSKEKEQSGFKVTDKRGQDKEADKTPLPDNDSAKDEQALPINFTSFVMSVSTSALVQMGLIADPMTQKVEKNLPLAKQQIDILEMLQEKTKGNLNEDEAKLMQQVMYELRMRYVEMTKAV